jgi:hypothetical protein
MKKRLKVSAAFRKESLHLQHSEETNKSRNKRQLLKEAYLKPLDEATTSLNILDRVSCDVTNAGKGSGAVTT